MTERQIEDLAEGVLQAFRPGIPINLDAICTAEAIELAAGDFSTKFHGRIEFNPEMGVFIIFHPAFGGAFPSGRVRFSICHELGHYFIDEHREMIIRGSVHNSSGPLRSVYNRIEDEADRFAAELLLPSKALRDLGVGQKEMTLSAILKLSAKFDASQQATAFRYVQLAEEPCVIVVARGDQVLSFRASAEADDRGFGHLGMKWIPDSSVASKCLKQPPGTFLDGATHTSNWFSDRNYGNDLWEESVRLGETDYSLTLLSWQ